MSDPKTFIAAIVSAAQEVQRRTGMFASVTIAQACLETGYSQYTPKDKYTQEESYNLFGIKAPKGEPSVYSLTTEELRTLPASFEKYAHLENGKLKVWVYDYFRKFGSFSECFIYRSTFLTRSKYWKRALDAKTPEDAVYALQHTGYFTTDHQEIAYATDSEYVDKLVRIINRENLKQYDLHEDDRYTEEEIQMMDELIARVDELSTKVHELESQAANRDKKLNPDPNAEVSSWAVPGYILVTTPQGKIQISDGTNPKGLVTREQVWTMLQRYHDIHGK